MMQAMKRGLALLIVLIMCLSLVPTLILNTSAATVDYVYSGSYIYNWGTRGTLATFLSPNAEDFYEDNNTSYDELSSYAGGTGKSDAPKSALYDALQDLMKGAHTHITSYAETRDLYKYTDCQNSGGKISSFYSGAAIGPAWGEGDWNREHTWPNSKGLGGNDENDLMMLRPTATSENSSRGNTAYGQSSGYYNPNSESGGKYDLRGDVARIFLYVYVRWGNINYAWGTSGVMESVEVLLEWMEVDPVDTWELGRNDSVESITGTRNVFVDYPELAFILFGEEIPADMSTPSGEAGGNGKDCGHNNFNAGVVTAPTCTQKGFTTYTCQTANCGYSYKGNATPALGHNYVNGNCSVCGEAEPSVPTYVTEVEVGKAYKLGLYSTEKGAEQYFSGTMTGYYGATDTNFANGVDVFVESVSGGYRMYFMNSSNQKQYINLVVSGTYRNFTFSSTATTVYTWDSAKNAMKTTLENEVCYIGTYGSYFTMGVLQSSKLKDTDYIARLYTMNGGSQDNPGDNPTCQHNYNTVVTAPTCTKGGFTTYTCTLCGDSYTGNQTAALDHSYSNGTCVNCGAAEPSENQATISFTSTANRTEFSTTKQVWVQNGITVTNEKASATSNVADYSNPVRFYQGSNVTISFPGMTKIEINCSGLDAKYVDSWLNVTGATATKSNGIVTIVFNAPTDSVTFTGLAKQSRAYSITVYAEGQSQPPQQECQHTSTTVEGAKAATCTTAGFTGNTVCTACGETVAQGKTIAASGHSFGAWTETTAPTCTTAGEERRNCNNCNHFETKEIAVLGHTDTNSDGLCDRCNENLGECKHINTTVAGTVAATCTTAGFTGKTICNVCGATIDEGNEIPATGHTMTGWVIIREPTCTKTGLERNDCDDCTYYEKNDIPALGHADKDEDTFCDVCGTEMKVPEETTPEVPEETTPETPEETTPDTPEETTPDTPDDDTTTETEEHVCKEVSGFQAFINSIINFFRRLFGQPELCPCGEVILEKED